MAWTAYKIADIPSVAAYPSGLGQAWAPFEYGGNLFVVLNEGAPTGYALGIYRSTNRGVAWTRIAAIARSTPYTRLTAYVTRKRDKYIYVEYCISGSSLAVSKFNMQTGAVDATFPSGFGTNQFSSFNPPFDIRSDGSVVISSVSIALNSPAYLVVSPTGVWGTITAIGSLPNLPFPCLGAEDRMHWLGCDQTTRQWWHQSMDAANAQGAATMVGLQMTRTVNAKPGPIVMAGQINAWWALHEDDGLQPRKHLYTPSQAIPVWTIGNQPSPVVAGYTNDRRIAPAGDRILGVTEDLAFEALLQTDFLSGGAWGSTTEIWRPTVEEGGFPSDWTMGNVGSIGAGSAANVALSGSVTASGNGGGRVGVTIVRYFPDDGLLSYYFLGPVPVASEPNVAF